MDVQKMTINGRAVGADVTLPVIDPATEEVFADAPACSAAQLDDAMDAAQAAFPGWAADDETRRKTLHAAADAVEASIGELASILTRENGKPLREAAGEAGAVAALLRDAAELDTGDEVFRDDGSTTVRLTRRPYGVVVAITPWNFPLASAGRKVAPALRAGNTCVLKPSPFTPLSSLLLGSILADVVPPGVLNVVTGGDDLGARMTSHPVPRKITFTGSTATGRSIVAASAGDLKRVTLELGGNDPAILLDDVDVATVAPAIFRAAFTNNGQACSAIKRVYVPRGLQAAVTDALVEQCASLTVGNGLTEGVDLGPLTTAPQYERVIELVDEARSDGARIATGGAPVDGPGYFYEPTIITDVDDSSRVVHEEQFGPVLPVIGYDDLDAAVTRANATDHGLDASVWGTDADLLARTAVRLECGTVWTNTHGGRSIDQPTGGHKESGLGVEGGIRGYEELTWLQVLHEVRP